MRFSVQGPEAEEGMHAFFFFADCFHEVENLTSGARLALVYTLFHRDGDAALASRGDTQGQSNHVHVAERKRKLKQLVGVWPWYIQA
jgi:hypothetical protein